MYINSIYVKEEYELRSSYHCSVTKVRKFPGLRVVCLVVLGFDRSLPAVHVT